MRLFELSNTSYSFNEITISSTFAAYEFITKNNLRYEIGFFLINSPVYLNYSSLQIEFILKNNNHRKVSLDITGTGDQFTILSTIKNIIYHQINSMNINDISEISFSADEPSRIKLYDKFVPIMLKILGNNWIIEYGKYMDGKLYKFLNKSKLPKVKSNETI